jgi:hypothetical protein
MPGSNTKRSPDKIIEGIFQGHVGTLCEDPFENTPLHFTTGKRLVSPDSSLSRNPDSLDAKLMVSVLAHLSFSLASIPILLENDQESDPE